MDVKYALREFGTSTCILALVDMENFFIGDRSFYEDFERPDDTPQYVLSVPFIRAEMPLERKWSVDDPLIVPGDVELVILDTSHNAIGHYDLNDVEISLASDGSAGRFRATTSLPPHAWAKPVWESWRIAPPATINKWWDIPVGQREGWVEVASHSRISTRSIGEEIVLDGRGIVDLASFSAR
ncbi:hypothetical protein ACFQES_30095 [Nonomuraea salmonea]|uniref:hypothetical protein n=1 Tax=Nonomuraea salmonea TaxID=46181 RepID=UPI00361A0C5C